MRKAWNSVYTHLKIKTRIRKGIPDSLRGGFAWAQVSESSVFRRKYPNLHKVDEAVATLPEKLVDEVKFFLSHFRSLLVLLFSCLLDSQNSLESLYTPHIADT